MAQSISRPSRSAEALTGSRGGKVAVTPGAPRFAAAWAALLYALCTLALMYPALGGAFLVSPLSDQYSGFAYREFAASVLRHTGSFPLWNPYILGGLPYVAAMHGDIFYPTFLLRMVMPADAAMTWGFGIHLFLAGMFMYLFLRAWGFGFYPALAGGVGYMMSGIVASLVSPGHDGKLYVSALTPFILWTILRGMRDGKIWAWGALAIATGLCVLSPHLQLTYYTGLLAAGFILWLAFRKGEGALERRVAIRRLAFAAVAALVGLLIGSIQFLPFFEYLPFAARGTAKGYEYATSYSMPPEELINVYLPQFSGIRNAYWGRNPLKFHSEYLGVAILVLAGAGLGSRLRRSFVRFWLIAAGIALLVAFGGHTPFYRLWYELPMMKVVRAPGMIFYIVALATAAVAAVGVERLFAREIGRRYLIGWGIAALVIAVLASVGFFEALGGMLGPLPFNHDAALPANAGAIIAGAWRSALFVALILGAIWALMSGRLSMTAAGWAFAIIAAVDLWSVERLYFVFSPPAAQLYAANPAIEYLQHLPEPARAISYPLNPGDPAAEDPSLSGDALMIHRVRATTGHQGNELQRWVDLAGVKSPGVDLQRVLDPRFRRLTNTKYLYTNVQLPPRIPELPNVTFTRRVGPVPPAVGGTAGSSVYLYELNGDAPPAWVAPVIVKATPEQILPTVLDARFDPRRAAIFDSSAAVPAVHIDTLPAASTVGVKITRYEPGHIALTLDQPAPKGSALIVSENYYPGWSATVDGKPAPIGRADYTLIGVALPEGGRQVELSFRSPTYERGKVLTLLALGVSALVIVAGIALDARGRSRPGPGDRDGRGGAEGPT